MIIFNNQLYNNNTSDVKNSRIKEVSIREGFILAVKYLKYLNILKTSVSITFQYLQMNILSLF